MTLQHSAAILMYHRVAVDGAEGSALCVHPHRFRGHLEEIRRRRFTTLSVSELANGVRQHELPPRSVAITLDDGYTDGLVCAAPLLTEFGIPATFFVVGEPLDVAGRYEYWWDTLRRVFLSGRSLPATLTVAPWNPLSTTTEADRRATYDTLVADFYQLSRIDRDDRLREIRGWSDVSAFEEASPRPLNAGELQELADLPLMSIGSHTESHLWLPAHPVAVKQREVFDSKARLQRILGRSVDVFSYPYGAFDEETAEVVARSGFQAAVTTVERLVSTRDDMLRLPRLTITNIDAQDFGDRLEHAFHF
jgi:peptidoglycan/xylan/chitin deacetylase (PgdA/CDA1 family)